MKPLIACLLSVLSFNVFAKSFMILDNGVVLTVAKDGFVYDFSHFSLPYKVTSPGRNFYVDNEKLVAISEQGFLYRSEVVVSDVKGKGGNYVIYKNQHVSYVDKDGTYYNFKDDAFKKASKFGGNFFVTNVDEKKKTAELYTFTNYPKDEKGKFVSAYFKRDADKFTVDLQKENVDPKKVEKLNPFLINIVGGNYFLADGILYTVSSQGFVFPKSDTKIPGIRLLGGNFFIDTTPTLDSNGQPDKKGFIYTIAGSGVVILPALPAELDLSLIVKVGSNYMIDKEGRLFTVDDQGNINYRSVNHDMNRVKVLSSK